MGKVKDVDGMRIVTTYNEGAMRLSFESIPYIRDCIKSNNIYFARGHYWCDDDREADRYICGTWDMFIELNSNVDSIK